MGAREERGAQIVDVPYDQLPDEFFSALLGRDLDPTRSAAATPPSAAEDEFESLSLEGVALPTENHLLWFLDALVAGVFGEVVRAKGSLPCGGQWLRFDVVDRAWSVTGAQAPEEGERGALGVFIGPELRRPWLRETLLPLVRDAVAAGHAEAALDDALDYQGEHHHDHDHDHGHEHHHDHEHHRERS